MAGSDTGIDATGRSVRMAVLVTPGALASCVSAFGDVFAIANALLARGMPTRPGAARFVVDCVSARTGPIELSSGLSIQAPARLDDGCELLVIPAIGNLPPEAVVPALEALAPEQALLLEAIDRGIRTASVCTGAFLMARTGALDGQRATVSWMFKPAFEAAFPQVLLESGQALVRSASGHLSTGGVASAHELALSLIAEFAEDAVRRQVASVLVAEGERSLRWPVDPLASRQARLEDVAARAKAWIEAHVGEPITASMVAQACHVTLRTLSRQLRHAFDQSATELIQHARVKLAMRLMQSTHLPFGEIASRCGVVDEASFRKVFKAVTGSTPLQYRKRFGDLLGPDIVAAPVPRR